MGRKRSNPEDAWLPPRVYRGRSAYEWHPKSGGNIRLAPLTAKPQAVLKRYDEEVIKASTKSDSIAALFEEFFQSQTFRDLAQGTQKQYEKNARMPTKVFGKVSTKTVKPEHVRQYMDKRGETAKVTANRELAFMSRVFSWAYERGKVTSNPCKGVRRFTETARQRYITDKEYYAVLEQADDALRAIIEISYCCAARVSDVLRLTRDDIREEGLFIKQGKTGKAQIKAWSPRLRQALEIAKGAGVQSSSRVISNDHGQPITYDAFRSRWNKAKAKAKESNQDLETDFTFHDVKAKSISDWTGDKQQFSGHKSQSMVAIYDRKVPVVSSHE